MFRKFKRGDRLVLELGNEEALTGDCVRTAANRIDLKNISDQDGRDLAGIMCFYTNQVVSVKMLCKKEPEESETMCSSSKKPDADSCSNSVDKILVDEEEFERLKQLVHNHTFIHQKDNIYHEACDELLSSESVGVVGLGCSAGRDSRLSQLVLTTWRSVYVFDVSDCSSKSMHKEIKEILQSGYVQKVVHDGRALVDCLSHFYGVKMNNVFDTLIADVTLRKRGSDTFDGKLRNISECLIEYFNFPEYLLYGAVRVPDKEWTTRPVEHEIKIKAALLGVYLLTLRDFLLGQLLQGYLQNVKSVYNMVTKSESSGVNKHLDTTTMTPELDAIFK